MATEVAKPLATPLVISVAHGIICACTDAAFSTGTEAAYANHRFDEPEGGVGKTTTTVNLGAALAELGKRVCLIDLDPQAHLTINYGVDPKPELVSMYDVLIEDRSFLEAVHTIGKNIALVPSSIDLAAAEIELVSVIGRETLLKHKLESVEHDFDFILLDCPPSLGLLTINALAVASEVIIPMQAHFLALQGVAKLLETVQIVNKRMNPQLKVGGIVLTMFDAQTKLSNEVVAELNGFIEQAAGKPLPWAAAKVFNTRIRRNIKLAECPSFGQTILQYDPLSNGALDYRNLAREIAGLPPLVVTVVAKPAAARPAVATAKPTGTTVASPVMPPALVAAIKASATKKPAAAPATTAPKAANPQPAPTKAATTPVATAPSTKTAPAGASPTNPAPLPRPAAASPASLIQRRISTPSLSLTPPPNPGIKPIAVAPAKPVPAKAPATAPTPVKVTVNPTIDQTKLSASNVATSPTSKPPTAAPAKAHAPTQEVA